MKFTVDYTSDKKTEFEIEINTLEELIAFTKSNGGRIVIFIRENKNYEIEIYDDYRE